MYTIKAISYYNTILQFNFSKPLQNTLTKTLTKHSYKNPYKTLKFVCISFQIVKEDVGEIHYEVLSMDSSGELDRNRLNLTLNLSSLIQSPSVTSIDTITPKEEYQSDGDEPLLSGTGLVSKDCSMDVLESWADVLIRWKSTKQRPKQLASLVRLGIPEALRGEVLTIYRYFQLVETSSRLRYLAQYNVYLFIFVSYDMVHSETNGTGSDSSFSV